MDQAPEGPSHALRRDPEEESNLPVATQHADSVYWTRTPLLPLVGALSTPVACVLSLALLTNRVLRKVSIVIRACTVGRESPRPPHSVPATLGCRRKGHGAADKLESLWGWRWGKRSPEAASGRRPHPGAAACSAWL